MGGHRLSSTIHQIRRSELGTSILMYQISVCTQGPLPPFQGITELRLYEGTSPPPPPPDSPTLWSSYGRRRTGVTFAPTQRWCNTNSGMADEFCSTTPKRPDCVGQWNHMSNSMAGVSAILIGILLCRQAYQGPPSFLRELSPALRVTRRIGVFGYGHGN